MRISMKSDYALRAMIELASERANRPLQSSEIASRRGIPESYLEQLLTTLRKAGLINSIRGPQGGHSLALHPSRITAGEVVRAMEGPMEIMDCLVKSGSCGQSAVCPVSDLWLDVRQAVETVLDGVTLEELAARQAARDGLVMYNI